MREMSFTLEAETQIGKKVEIETAPPGAGLLQGHIRHLQVDVPRPVVPLRVELARIRGRLGQGTLAIQGDPEADPGLSVDVRLVDQLRCADP